MKTAFFILPVLLSLECIAAGEWRCEFSAGRWNQEEWTRVKSARWAHVGGWTQEKERIVNQVPADATPAELLSSRAGETYSSMIWNRKISGNATISSRMEFADRMAPLIVLAAPPEICQDGVHEYREHWEILLFDEGINVWHHQYRNGRPRWSLAGYMKKTLKPHTVYDLQVQIIRRGALSEIRVKCDGGEFGFELANLPEEFYAGITGCEGVNYFYDFRVNTSGK